MDLGLKNRMAFQGTVVSNAFIDTYMAAANGEYVKVFLYLLRHNGEEITVSAIADALDHTESDVKRALAYWEEAGLLEREGAGERPEACRGAEKEAAAAREPEIPEEGNSCDRLERAFYLFGINVLSAGSEKHGFRAVFGPLIRGAAVSGKDLYPDRM